jgi:hypothetical protein
VRANRATQFAATLLSGLVTPRDLPADGAGADAAVGLRRKNLKELRRMRLEGDDASFPEIEGASETRAASGRPAHKEREWPGLPVAELALRSMGWLPWREVHAASASTVAASTHGGGAGSAAGSARDAEGDAGDAAPDPDVDDAGTDAGTEEEEEEEAAIPGPPSPVWALDVPSVHGAIHGRDRAFDGVKAEVRVALDELKREVQTRLDAELFFKGKWAGLVRRANAGVE